MWRLCAGDFFIPSFQCPHHVERIGVLGDGGKWVCGVERLAKQEKCVIYSFGSSISHLMFGEADRSMRRHQRRVII